MSRFEMFCERCGKRYGSEEATAAGSLPLARRLLNAVGVSVNAPRPPHDEPLLRFCLACRGYSCTACWNDDAGFCQTCVPLPEPEPVAAETAIESFPQPVFEAPPAPVLLPMPAAMFEAPVDPVFGPAEAVAEPVAEPMAAEPVAAGSVEMEPFLVAAEPEPTPTAAEPEAAPEPVLVQPEQEATPEPLIPTFAELEPPIDVLYAEEASYTEPEPDVQWDWSLDLSPEPEAESQLVAETEPAVATEPVAPEMPTAPELPTPPVAPIFRPLPPMGPLIPPPPPGPVAPLPRIEFELPGTPPAFLLARPPMAPVLRPTLPAGLFDGPGPQVRPCPSCNLPVSAKARFCRRCGSAQS